MDENDVEALHRSLTERRRPENVASLIGRLIGPKLSKRERLVLGRASRHSEAQPFHWSMMTTDWEQPISAAAQVSTVTELFGSLTDVEPLPVPDDPDAVRAWTRRLGEGLGWSESSLKLPSRAEAEEQGWSGSRRAFVRRWKALHHLHDKADRLERNVQRRSFAVAGRGGLVGQIGLDEVRRDLDAASFCAYFVARTNVRRGFSLHGKDNPMDEVAGMLLDRLGRNADWWMVARCHSSNEAVRHLTDEQRGALLARWWSQMREAGERLGELNHQVPVDRAEMIVRRGMDSATWNLAAQAFNKARDGWLAVVDVIGQLALLDSLCPPKAMRLMAGDLAAWRRSVGQDPIAPDVKVAARLPPPWEVVLDTPCGRADVIRACEAEQVDPFRTGWAGPRPGRGRAVFRPTPELVHGIIVADPLLASALRRGGAFSGKRVKPDVIDLVDRLGEVGFLGRTGEPG